MDGKADGHTMGPAAEARPRGEQALAGEVSFLRNGLTALAEAMDVVQPALQKEVELRSRRDRQVETLELQIKDLRSDLCEIMSLKVKQRLTALEREGSETRRRLLHMSPQPQSCRRGACRSASPEKAKEELQEMGEALLDRARREMQRQEDLVQSRLASERQEAVLRDEVQRRAEEAAKALSDEVLEKAKAVHSETTMASREAKEGLQQLSLKMEHTLEQASASSAVLAEGLGKAEEAERSLRQELAKIASVAGNAQQEAKRSAQMTSRLSAGIRGVEEALERKIQWMETTKTELKESISESAVSSSSALRGVQDVRAEAERREAAMLQRFEEALRRGPQAWQLEELKEAMAERRHEELNLVKKVKEQLRREEELKEKMEKEGRDTVEAAGRAVAEVRRELQQELVDRDQEVSKVKDDLGRLGRDLEEKLKELERQLLAIGQRSASSEIQVRESLANSDRLERRMEELVREYRAQDRSELRVMASKTESHCEEQVRQLLWQVEDQTKLVASQTEEGWRLAQALQDRAAKAVDCAEVEAQRLAARGEAQALEMARLAEVRAEELAKCAEERAALAAKLTQAEARRLCARGEARAEELTRRAEEQVAEVRHLAHSLVATTQEQTSELSKKAEERATELVRRAEDRAIALAKRAEDESQCCRSLVEEMSRSHLVKVESMQEVIRETLKKMEELEMEYRSSLQHFARMKEEAFAAAQGAVQAQEESAATRGWVEESLRVHEGRLKEVQAELNAFIDEQRVFCGFIDTEQRSYQELIRQEVRALSRVVDASLRIDPRPLTVGSPSSLEGIHPLEPMGSPLLMASPLRTGG